VSEKPSLLELFRTKETTVEDERFDNFWSGITNQKGMI
jgi:hypothetical protein